MKKNLILLLGLLPVIAFSQGGMGIGIKAGLNFANVTKASSINSSSRSGFNVALFMAPPSKGIMSSRTEIVFSRQGYNYGTGTNTGNVNLDYIMLPQHMGINITKYVQLQIGAQMAYLLNAKVDSSGGNGGTGYGDSGSSIMDMYNRFDYGYGGGIEIYPVSGLLIGARINVSMGNLYKQMEAGQQPSFIPNIDAKNNVVQIYLGWRFGKKETKKKGKDTDQ